VDATLEEEERRLQFLKEGSSKKKDKQAYVAHLRQLKENVTLHLSRVTSESMQHLVCECSYSAFIYKTGF